MKKWLILTTLTALLLGACSTENEVSEQDSDKQTALVQKEDKNKSEKSDKEKKEKAEKEKLEIEKKEKEKKAEEERKLREEEERKKQEEERKAREAREEQARKEAEAKQIAEQAEATVQQLENNQVQDNVVSAQAAVERVADTNIKSKLEYRIGLVQNAINVRAQQAAEAEQARQAAEQARQAAAAQQAQQQQAFASQPQQGAFRNCREARAAGAAPLYRGQPGYGSHLDRDGDGVACE